MTVSMTAVTKPAAAAARASRLAAPGLSPRTCQYTQAPENIPPTEPIMKPVTPIGRSPARPRRRASTERPSSRKGFGAEAQAVPGVARTTEAAESRCATPQRRAVRMASVQRRSRRTRPWIATALTLALKQDRTVCCNIIECTRKANDWHQRFPAEVAARKVSSDASSCDDARQSPCRYMGSTSHDETS